MNATKSIHGPALVAMFVLLGSFRAVAAADLIIATNAEVIFPPSLEQVTYFYFFTVVDDGGGIGTPVITNLGYPFGSVNLVDVYDNEEFTYGTFEVVVTVAAPALGSTVNDCFTISYEGESVNPCFDVTRAPRQSSAPDEIAQACVNQTNGLVRIVHPDVSCRVGEYRMELALPTPEADTAAVEALGVPTDYRPRGE
jgi:hypothetical protein